MKTIVKVAVGALVAASLFTGCKSTSFSKEAHAKNVEKGFTSASWTLDGKTPSKAMVGKTLNITSDIDTSRIPNGTTVNIIIHYDNNGATGIVDTIAASVVDGKVSRNWVIKDHPSFYSAKVYSVPKYSFKFSAENGNESEESDPISIYGWIHTQVKNADGEIKANQKVVIYKSDDTTITKKTDDEGYIDLKWLPLGQYSFTMIKDEPAAEEAAETSAQ